MQICPSLTNCFAGQLPRCQSKGADTFKTYRSGRVPYLHMAPCREIFTWATCGLFEGVTGMVVFGVIVMVGNPAPGAASEPGVKIGATFAGRYRILGPLGEGNRKRTYLAEDTTLGRKVALALVKQTAECGPSPTVQEWQALAQTGNNDNIVTLHDRGIRRHRLHGLRLPGGRHAA